MRRVLFAPLVLFLGAAGSASADPITLTSGHIFTTPHDEGSFNFSGSAFNAGGAGTGAAPFVFNVGTLDLSGHLGLSPSNPNADFGFVTVDGQTQRGFASAGFQVTADPFVITDAPEGTFMVFKAPFSATGLVTLSARFHGQVIFSQEVNGTGTMSISGVSIGDGQYRTLSEGLDFSPASATPEPASVLLLGTGLAAAWRSRRVRAASTFLTKAAAARRGLARSA